MSYYEPPAPLTWLPAAIKAPLRRWHRTYMLDRAVAALEERLARGGDASRRSLNDLVYGWGNEGMSAQPGYLAEVIAQARTTTGTILECGSGLTTLVLGLIARRRAGSVLSLEDNSIYAQDVRSRLARYSIAHAEIVHAPLIDYGAFTWYQVPTDQWGQFSLVICDGPSPVCPSGRYGLLPLMRGRCVPGCVILLDDAETAVNRDLLRRWATELSTEPQILGREKPFAVIRLP